MIKFMLFIDGTWLYSNTPRLVEAANDPTFMIDFGKLPRVLAEEVARRLGHSEYTVVRTHLFGSYADNVDPRDAEPVQRRLNYFSMLRQQHHYEIEAFPINFRGKRLRITPFEPIRDFYTATGAVPAPNQISTDPGGTHAKAPRRKGLEKNIFFRS